MTRWTAWEGGEHFEVRSIEGPGDGVIALDAEGLGIPGDDEIRERGRLDRFGPTLVLDEGQTNRGRDGVDHAGDKGVGEIRDVAETELGDDVATVGGAFRV